MARLAAIEKGEYYPTPLSIVDQITSVLDIEPDGRGVIRLFDPCAGEGLALERLAAQLKQRGVAVETWGVEISPDRARQAVKRLDTVVEAPFEATQWSPALIKSPVSLAFVNPPYDSNGNGGRLEQDFLVRVTGWLGNGAVLAFLVPWSQMTWGMCQQLTNQYRDIEVFRFPDGSKSNPASFDSFGQIVVLARRDTGKAESYNYDEGRALYELIHGSFQHTNSDAAARRLPDSPNGRRYALPRVGYTPQLKRKGYTWQEIAEACQDYSEIAQKLLPDNTQMDAPLCRLKVGHIAQVVAAGLAGTFTTHNKVFKGRAIKVPEIIPDPVDTTKETVIDRYETHIAYVSPYGYVHLSAPPQVAAFLKEHVDLFRQHIETHFHPYGTEVQDWEWDVLGRLSLDKQIPGRKELGLFEDQKRSAVALTRSVKRYGVAHLVAEMGYGKTRTSLAAVELMHARNERDGYPVLITCPPHLVDGWKKEAESAIPGLKAIIVESITELERAVENYQPGNRLAVIISHSRIKMGPGWKPAYNLKTIFCRDNKGNHVAKRVAVCPGCGKPVVDGETARTISELEKKPLTCQHTVPVWDEAEKTWSKRKCNTPLYQFAPIIARRWPLADYIADKLPRFFKALVFDEVHKAKAKETDIGNALQILARLMPTITLTGTFFGGLSSSIMYLLFRTQANIHKEFGFDDERRWVERFGVLETVFQVEEDFGMQSARKRRRLSTKEQPGLSPEAIKYMLPTTVFAKVADLGLEMPLCNEEITPIDLGFLSGHISAVWSWTWEEMKNNWPNWTSSWLQCNLARPNSAFRDEVIEGFSGGELPCPAQVKDNELLPKEQWLVNAVRAELAQGRKTIVYLRQTGTRDIRGRIQKVLTTNGVSDVAVLGSNVGTHKRADWLDKNAGQVLITNPKLVETGMNLHEYGYCTIIFFEIEYSLYTLWQAMSRVWRPGQTKKVKIYFTNYTGTLEEKALTRIGKKMMTGQLLYGEDVTSALVEDTGDASLVIDLIRSIQDGDDLRVHADMQIFGTMGSDLVTESPLGSATARSRTLTTTEQWLKSRGLTIQQVVKPAKKKSAKVADGQMQFDLFALPKAA